MVYQFWDNLGIEYSNRPFLASSWGSSNVTLILPVELTHQCVCVATHFYC